MAKKPDENIACPFCGVKISLVPGCRFIAVATHLSRLHSRLFLKDPATASWTYGVRLYICACSREFLDLTSFARHLEVYGSGSFESFDDHLLKGAFRRAIDMVRQERKNERPT